MTMQDIATAAGVSVTTVSHALSGKRSVSASTQERIRRIVDESGYVPDAAGRRLKTGRSGVIALAVPDVSDRYFGSIARGAEEEADRRGYGLLVSSTGDSDPNRESRYFNLVRTRSVDGLLYTGSRDMKPSHDLARLSDQGPVVLVDEEMPALTAPFVASDNLEGGRVAGRHLLALGHNKAVVFSGPQGLKSQVERVQGFRESFPPSLVLHGEFDIESGYRSASDVLDSGLDFTAIFAGNDLIAIGAIQCLRERGFSVPDDVSVIGFDDIDLAGFVSPTLTTVRQNSHEMGAEAARRLLTWLDTGNSPESAVIPVELVDRQSTAACSQRAEKVDSRSQERLF
ncbi:MAG: LacI family DNA-binding transcriptional regulator [Mycobacteriaceae bacterium]|uniref:LacI family DNA-binding transcriptional regulator n=1 Tax=Corynebacterium sp. TaxID=1720 RepID=UPI003F9717C9